MKNASSSERRKPRGRRLFCFCLSAFLAAFLLLLCHRCVNFLTHIRQTAVYASLVSALEIFRSEFEVYPPSDALDDVNQPYCGAMKLTEAMVGQDLLGFRPASTFRLDGTDPKTGEFLYATAPPSVRARRGPFLDVTYTAARRMGDVYGKGNAGPFPEHVYVLCDVFERRRPGGAETGMPILYYRADREGAAHDVNAPDNPENIYDYRDNQMLIGLGVPGKPGKAHPLADPKRFYINMRSHKSPEVPRPYRADSYILISAGRDGLYGTKDDICNFDWKYRER